MDGLSYFKMMKMHDDEYSRIADLNTVTALFDVGNYHIMTDLMKLPANKVGNVRVWTDENLQESLTGLMRFIVSVILFFMSGGREQVMVG